MQSIFCRGVYLAKNTSQSASVEFVRHQRTNYARGRLQAFCPKKGLALFVQSRKMRPRGAHFYNTRLCPLFFPQGQGAPGHHRVGVIVDVSAPDPLDGVVALSGQDDHRPLRGLQNGLLHRPGAV